MQTNDLKTAKVLILVATQYTHFDWKQTAFQNKLWRIWWWSKWTKVFCLFVDFFIIYNFYIFVKPSEVDKHNMTYPVRHTGEQIVLELFYCQFIIDVSLFNIRCIAFLPVQLHSLFIFYLFII